VASGTGGWCCTAALPTTHENVQRCNTRSNQQRFACVRVKLVPAVGPGRMRRINTGPHVSGFGRLACAQRTHVCCVVGGGGGSTYDQEATCGNCYYLTTTRSTNMWDPFLPRPGRRSLWSVRFLYTAGMEADLSVTARALNRRCRSV
jgi:hypothetical protein